MSTNDFWLKHQIFLQFLAKTDFYQIMDDVTLRNHHVIESRLGGIKMTASIFLVHQEKQTCPDEKILRNAERKVKSCCFLLSFPFESDFLSCCFNLLRTKVFAQRPFRWCKVCESCNEALPLTQWCQKQQRLFFDWLITVIIGRRESLQRRRATSHRHGFQHAEPRLCHFGSWRWAAISEMENKAGLKPLAPSTGHQEAMQVTGWTWLHFHNLKNIH